MARTWGHRARLRPRLGSGDPGRAPTVTILTSWPRPWPPSTQGWGLQGQSSRLLWKSLGGKRGVSTGSRRKRTHGSQASLF